MIATAERSTEIQLTGRDMAVLRAVAAGRCELIQQEMPVLTVDGRCFCDQSAAPRLTRAGLIAAGPAQQRAAAMLTTAGMTALAAA